MNNITITKSQAEVYTIRFKEHRDWWIQAVIIENRGYLALNTSHGDWSYTWSSPGCPFKEFLTQIDDCYLTKKLGRQQDRFNGEESFKRIKKDVLRLRRDLEITCEVARNVWDSLGSMDCSSEVNYWRSLDEMPIIFQQIYDYCDVPCVKEFDPSLKLFVKDMWPAFVKVLKNELS